MHGQENILKKKKSYTVNYVKKNLFHFQSSLFLSEMLGQLTVWRICYPRYNTKLLHLPLGTYSSSYSLQRVTRFRHISDTRTGTLRTVTCLQFQCFKNNYGHASADVKWYFAKYIYYVGTAVAPWLRCCATNQKVAGSIPAGVIGIFRWHKILPIALWPWGRLNL